MKKLLAIALLLLSVAGAGAQGLNNDHKFDTEDLRVIFKEQGIQVFKYPFALLQGEYISISYEVYDRGRCIKRRSEIEQTQVDYGMRFNHHHAKRDTTILQRIYFFDNADSLVVKFSAPGITFQAKFDVSNVHMSDINSCLEIPTDLIGKRDIAFYYANYHGSGKGAFLPCSTGMTKEKLTEQYDLVVMVSAERISKERAAGYYKSGFGDSGLFLEYPQ